MKKPLKTQLTPSLETSLSQRLRLTLSQYQVQLIRTMQLPYHLLYKDVSEKVSDNPLLEFERHDQLTDFVAVDTAQSAVDFSEYAQSYKSDQTLTEYLYLQRDRLYLADRDHEIFTDLVDRLDKKGFLLDYKDAFNELSEKYSVQIRKIKDVLYILQECEPAGVAARSIEESLLLQYNRTPFEDDTLDEMMILLLTKYIHDLSESSYSKLSKQLSISEDAVKQLHDYIKDNLSSNPCSDYVDSEQSQIVTPSFRVIRNESNVLDVINLEKEHGFKLRLSDEHLRLLEDPKLDSETKLFLENHLKEAKAVIEQIENRQKLILEAVRTIVQFQEAYFSKGEPFLKPLLQKEVSAKLGLSAASVSRLLSQKYLESDQGVILLKELCPRRYFGKTQSQLIEFIRRICLDNPGWSDQVISDYLKKNGVNIARRTVNKYRLKSFKN